MALIRWNPLRDLPTWSSVADLLPELSFFRGGNVDDGSYGTFWSPAMDIVEHDDAYVVECELPGLTKEDVKISVQGNILTIRGEKKSQHEEKGANYHRQERTYGSFVRSFTLPSYVKSDKIDARYVNGILTINLPKAEEAKPKDIEVKVK